MKKKRYKGLSASTSRDYKVAWWVRTLQWVFVTESSFHFEYKLWLYNGRPCSLNEAQSRIHIILGLPLQNNCFPWAFHVGLSDCWAFLAQIVPLSLPKKKIHWQQRIQQKVQNYYATTLLVSDHTELMQTWDCLPNQTLGDAQIRCQVSGGEMRWGIYSPRAFWHIWAASPAME